MSLSQTRFGGNAPGLPAALPSLPAALARRAAIFGTVASAGALAGSMARAAGTRTAVGLPMTADAALPPAGRKDLATAPLADNAKVTF